MFSKWSPVSNCHRCHISSYLSFDSGTGSMFEQDRGLPSHILTLETLFQCRVKGVINAGDKNGLNFKKITVFLKRYCKSKSTLKI